jgi:NADPH-dependent 2,4-dienoyl-CoA reductase/sulfur reductase-like enzyme
VHDVLIVGASAGGLTVAEALRTRGFDGTIGLVDDDTSPPYDRPPLSKQVLSGAWQAEQVHLRPPERLDELRLDFVRGRAVTLDPPAHRVGLATGKTLPYGVLVAATGLRPRMPDAWTGLGGVHVMHSLADSLALRDELTVGSRVVVIGAGVLGCEIAATARTLGSRVTLVEELAVPMQRQIGAELGGRVRRLHESHGVELVTGRVRELTSSAAGRVTGVEVGGGVLPADVVVVAMGGTPQVDWMSGAAGISVADGIECDRYCRAAHDVYAVGDVARWHHEGLGVSVRWENRTNATEQALTVARNILGEQRPYTPIPYFWSDQYDVKLQVFGGILPESSIELIEGGIDDDRFVAVARTRGAVDAVIGWNHPRGARTARSLLVERYATAGPGHG